MAKCSFFDRKGDKVTISLLGLVICCLLVTNFFLEIDIVLTKIEEIPNAYISFTSSALAAFALPELYLVGQALLKQFNMLKYGICIVLILLGIQMLLSNFFSLSPGLDCIIIATVLLGSIVVSLVLNECFGYSDAIDSSSSTASPVRSDDGNEVVGNETARAESMLGNTSQNG